MPGIPTLFQQGAAAIVNAGGAGSTLRLRRYVMASDPVTRRTTRTLAYGPVDVPAMRSRDDGRRVEGASRRYMIAKGVDPDFDAQPEMGGNWTLEDADGREVQISRGVRGQKLDGKTVSWWTVELDETDGSAGR